MGNFFKKLEKKVKKLAHQTEKHVIRPVAHAVRDVGLNVHHDEHGTNVQLGPQPPQGPQPR